jgi:TolB-like protein/thioredoxin-like negative regulator of GroEL
MSLIGELKRRGVIRVAVAYLAASWLLIQVADTVFPAFGLSTAALTVLIVVLAVGLTPALLLSWKFELTPGGVRPEGDAAERSEYARKTARHFDRAITLLLVIGIGYFAIDKFAFDPLRDAAREQEVAQRVRTEVLVESYGDKSIAVLPFVNMSTDPEQEYFSDGMAEEILNLLARVEGLRVISRSSAFSFKGKDFNIREVADKLNVAHVLEGSVRKSGNSIRITAQLIEARSDTHLWSETYDRELENIFVIQDEIAATVAEQLKIRLLGDAPKATRADPQAYALYLQARYLINTFVPETMSKAEPLLEQALTIDPDYVPALLMRLRLEIMQMGGAPSPEFRRLFEQIIAIDPDNEIANALQSAGALFGRRDIPSAVKFLERAMSRPSTDVDMLSIAADILPGLGMHDTSAAVLEYVLDRDPTCIACRYRLASAYRYIGSFSEAEAMMKSAVDLLPQDSAFRFALARTQFLNGKAQVVLDWVEENDLGSEGQRAALEVMALHDIGREAEARAALDELYRRHGEEEPLQVAEALAWTGDVDRALDLLANRVPDDAFFFDWDSPFFARLHDDPRWHSLLERHGVAPEQLEALDIQIRLPPGVTIVKR